MKRSHGFPTADAWDAVVAVTAPAYGVAAEILGAPSRGRGPRPPKEVWSARKMAVHLGVAVAGCDYAELGRHVGLHRDTVAGHCALMRAACADDDDMQVLARGLELAARTRLLAAGAPAMIRVSFPDANARFLNVSFDRRINALERHMADFFAGVRKRLSDDPTPSDASDTSRSRDNFVGTGASE